MTEFADRFTIEDGDGERFQALFVNVWDALPEWARRAIKETYEGVLPPVILTDNPIAFGENEPAENVRVRDIPVGLSLEYFGLVFRAGFVDAMPDALVCTVIAHELGHLYLDTPESETHQLNMLPVSLSILEEIEDEEERMDIHLEEEVVALTEEWRVDGNGHEC